MTPVSTASMFSTALLNIENNQSQLVQLSDEAGSGFNSQDLAGYGDQAGQLTALNSTFAKLTSYVNSATAVSGQLDTQTTALTQVGAAVQNAVTAVQTAVGNNDATTLMQTLQSDLTQAAGALNTQVNGQYLFAGGNGNTPPVANSDLSTLTTAASVTAAFQNGQTITTAQLGGNTTVQTGVLASDVATPFYNALQQIAAFNAGPNGPLDGSLNQTQSDFLNGVMTQLNSALDTANNATAANGVVQSEVTNIQNNLTDQQTSVSGMISNVADANEASVANQITLAQTALDVSAQVFQGLQNSSLLNLLSPQGSVT